MSSTQFRLSIGAKRQLTLPSELLQQLQVPERGELLIEVIGDHAVVTPMVTIPRAPLPEELRRTFESRRGSRPSDVPLAQFLKQAGYPQTGQKTAPKILSTRERIANLTPNEKKVLKQAREKSAATAQTSRLTPRQRQVLEQSGYGHSAKQTAQDLGLAEHTIKSMEGNLRSGLKPSRLRQLAQNESRSERS